MKKRKWSAVAGILGISCILNFVAWISPTFCDWYVEKVFPVWGPLFGLFTELTDKSVGEIMIVSAVILVTISLVLSLVAIVFCLLKKCHGYRRFFQRYICELAVLSGSVILVMTLNCFVLYHCSTFKDKYLSDYLTEDKVYSAKELGDLRDMVVNEANKLAKTMKRDEYGRIVYEGDINAEAITSMEKLGIYFPQLSGYYSTPKPLAMSDFFSQQYMEGYYFPFSLEANYNDVMYVVNMPSTICHELAHTKGFIYEDEANMISFLACINSDDPFFRYSGYLSVLNYIDRDYKKSINNDKGLYNNRAKISATVKKDNVFLMPEAWEKVEKKAVVSTQTARKVSKTITETVLVANGVEDGVASYCDVVGLMMDYYVGCAENPMADVLTAER